MVGRSNERLIDDCVRTNRHAEQPRGHVCDGSGSTLIGPLTRHGRRRTYVERLRSARTAVAQTADQDRDIRPLPSPVGMELVEDDEPQPARIIDHASVDIILPRQQEFGHHEVRQQDIGRVRRDFETLLLSLLARVASHDGSQFLW